MSTSDKVNLIDISDEEKNIFKKKLKKSKMIQVEVVNLNDLNNFQNFTFFFSQFKELMENKRCFKILYSKTENAVKNLPSSIDWRNRDDVVYVGKELTFNKDIIRSYWNWRKHL